MPAPSQSSVTAANAPAARAKSHWLGAAAGHIVRSALRLENAFYEYRFGLATHGLYNWKPGDSTQEEHLYYLATSYRRIFRILDALHLGSTDVFVDLGCGKGRVTCCASLYPLREVIGVEDVAELCAVAEQNLARLRHKRAPARILQGRAEQLNYSTGTVIYMFHPFGRKTLQAVLSGIAQGIRVAPRNVRVVYVNPVHEPVLKQMDWLERYDYWPPVRVTATQIMHPVSFWKVQP